MRGSAAEAAPAPSWCRRRRCARSPGRATASGSPTRRAASGRAATLARTAEEAAAAGAASTAPNRMQCNAILSICFSPFL
jgi:hypothetical protein